MRPMQKMRDELRAYLVSTGLAQKEFSRMLGKHRNYVTHSLVSDVVWRMDRAELLDDFVGFSDEAWDEAYAEWDRSWMEKNPGQEANVVEQHKKNPPITNWKVA